MKIAIITPTFPPYNGGIGKVAADHAFFLRQRGHEVAVFTPAYRAGLEAAKGDSTAHFIKPWLSFGNAAILAGLAKQLDSFEIIHLHYPFFGTAELIWLKSRRLKKHVKIIIHYHMDVVGTGWKRIIFGLHSRWLLPRIVNCADRVIATSDDYAEHSFLKKIKLKTKVVALPNGVDATFFTPDDTDTFVREKYQIAPEERIVLFIGGLDDAHYFKGVTILLGAMAKLTQTAYSWRLIVGGTGNLVGRYQALSQRLGLGERVIFSGSIPQAQLPSYYRAADVTVLPSVDASEAFGVVLIESMACQTPVVASNLPGVRSVVDQSVGLLAPAKDAEILAQKINQSIADPVSAKKMGVAGREKVLAHYDWPRVIEQLEKIYSV